MDNIINNVEQTTTINPSINVPQLEAWQFAIIYTAKYYRLDFSEENLRLASFWSSTTDEQETVKMMARHVGMVAKFVDFDKIKINSWILPLTIQLTDGQIGVIQSISLQADKKIVTILFEGQGSLPTQIELEQLVANIKKVIIFRPIINAIDSRADEYIKPKERHWIWRIVFRDMKPYVHVGIASFVISVLGLAGITFSMHTYDRVIPSQSYSTMAVLATGVLLAFVLDYILKMLRYSVLDLLGKKADLRISDRVFGKILRIKNSQRPQSTGSFITQIRDLEQVREMVSSSTVAAIADLPFFFFFLWVIFCLGGIVFLSPLIGAFLMVIPGLLYQKKLEKLANDAQREATLRSGMLVEAVQGLDDIKATQSEYKFQQQWLHYTETTASCNLEQKHLTHKLMTWNYLVQNSVFVGVICIGVPFAMVGQLSTGALVASSILSSRMMGPISQIANLVIRWQQTKVAITSIDNIMDLAVDVPEGSRKIHKAYLNGNILFNQASFKYRNEDPLPAISVNKLQIRAGEKIAILGRNGSGKTSFLNAIAGMMHCDAGSISIDHIDLNVLNPADLRRDLGYLNQNAHLFHGTIRDNLVLGNPIATEEDIIQALKQSGAINFIQKMPSGLGYQIREGGLGLSAGQRQMLLISRMLIRKPSIILLDEPTSMLDEIVEQQFIEHMRDWLQDRTAIIATHRKKILDIVDRIIVIEDGKIVLDKSKDEALSSLS